MTENSQIIKTVGHHIVQQLESQGVQRVFCVPGESYLDVLDGLHDSPIQVVTCRHEGGAGMMAMAEARLTGRAGTVMVTRGPGAANAMIALHNAWQDGTPLVLFVGLINSQDRGREAFQDFSLTGWFGSTTKQVFTLDNPNDAKHVVAKAFAIAESERPGPVVIGLPEDVLTEEVSLDTFAKPSIRKGITAQSSIENLIHDLEHSKRPLIVLGGEGWSQTAALAVASAAVSLSVPVVTDFRCSDLIDNNSPAYIGMLGYGNAEETNLLLDDADLIIFLGSVRSDVLSRGYILGLNAKSIVISESPEFYRHFGRLDDFLQISPERFAIDLNTYLQNEIVAEPSEDKKLRLSQARVDYENFSDPSKAEIGSPFLREVFEEICQQIPDDVIVTYGAGNYAIWPQRFVKSRVYPAVLAPKNGAMGFGVPAAIAAALAFKDRQTVSFAGDGCFLMNGQELAVAVSLGLRLTIFIMDNQSYGTIRQHQERDYPGRVISTRLENPDFFQLATAYGATGYHIDNTDDYRQVIREVLNQQKGVSVVHVKMDTGPM